MTTYYLDLESGSDALTGTSFANRVKTFSKAVSLMAAGDALRIKSSPYPTLVGNAAWANGSAAITLASAVTMEIDNCEAAWVAGTNVTTAAGTTNKQGTWSSGISLNSSFTQGLIAYDPIPLGVSAPTNTIVSRASNMLGAASLTQVVSSYADDANVAISLPFAVLYLGISYTTVYVGSNGYLTFGAGSSVYNTISASNPPIPGIHISAGDRSYQAVYAGSENGGSTFRIRYEGSSSSTSSPANIFWEITFQQATPNQILVDIGTNNSFNTGTSGFTNGSTYVQVFNSNMDNKGYTFTYVPGTVNAVDFSAYQQVSLWFQSTSALTAGQLSLTLCSDAAGTVPVATLPIPAYASISMWQSFTLDAGTALPNNVKSVALSANSNLASVTIRLDNIIACKASSSPDSLTHNSLIGKVCNLSWAANTAYSLNDIRRPTQPNRNGFMYKVTTAGVSAHRYWRVYITGATNSTTGVELSSVELYTSVGGSNIALLSSGVTAIADSYFGTNIPANAFDNSSSLWSAAASSLPHWIGCDLGAGNAASVLQFGLQVATAYTGNWTDYTPSTFTLQYSDDGTTWTSCATPATQTSWGASELRKFSVALSSSAEPTWPTETGLTITDGNLVWTCYDLEESWFTIQNINGTTVTLDTSPQTPSANTGKYQGLSETVATYKCEPNIQVPSGTSSTLLPAYVANTSSSNQCTYSGGWNRTDMSTQDGETWLSAQNNTGNMVSVSGSGYFTFENFNLVRGGTGYNLSAASVFTFKNVHINSCDTSLTGIVGKKITFNNLSSFYSSTCGFDVYNGSIVEGKCMSVWGIYGFFPTTGIRFGYGRIRINYLNTKGNGYGVYGYDVNNSNAVGDAIFSNVTASNNSYTLYSPNIVGGVGFVNPSSSDTSLMYTGLTTAGEAWFQNLNGTKGYTYKAYQGGSLVRSVMDTVHTAGGLAWKFSPGSTTALHGSIYYPLRLSVAKVYCQANVQKSVTIWTRRDGTNVKGRLQVDGGQLAGMSTQYVDCQPSINTWVQSIALTFTPAESGVIEVEFLVWDGVTNNQNFWIDDLTVN